MARFLDANEVEARAPGLLPALEARGVSISNNAGAILVDGYLDAIEPIASEAQTSRKEGNRG